MELRQCRYFVAVVDAMNITRAAHKLHVVQSAVSHQVARLEDELQATLLERTRSGVVPTEAGRLLYVHAQAILKHVQVARESIRALHDEVCGTVAIGLPSSTAAVLAVPLLKEVRARLPQVLLSVSEGLGNVLADELARGALDVSILFDQFDNEPLRRFKRLPLVKERMHFVCALPQAKSALARRTSVTLAEVARWPLILPPHNNSVRTLVDREAQRRDVRLTVVGELSGVKTILDAVEAGIAGALMMAANAGALSRRKGVLVVPIRNPVIERTASLFQSEQFPSTPASDAVRALLLEVVKDLVARGLWEGAELV